MSKQRIGSMPDGSDVYEIILRNNKGMEAHILTQGAIIKDLFVPGKDGKIRNVVCGQDTLADTLEKTYCSAMVVGRVANRIGNAAFSIDGKTYRVEVNESDRNCLHSGSANYASRNYMLESEDGRTVTLSLDDPEEKAGGFPGNASLRVKYTVTDEQTLEIAYEFMCDRDTPVNLTNHAYFNLSGADTILDHAVIVDADACTPTDAELIPTGEIADVSGTILDLRECMRLKEVVTQTGGLDHNFVLNGSGYRKVAELLDASSGRKMTVYTDRPGMQIYTAGHFDESLTQRGGKSLRKFGAICFETQTFPDAVNKPHFPEGVLKAGTKLSTKTGYQFDAI